MQVLLDRKFFKSVIALILGVHRMTLAGFVRGIPYVQANGAAFATL